MSLREFIYSALVSFGIAGNAGIVRAIFVKQEESAWSKFLRILGSVLFGGMVGILIKTTYSSGWVFEYVNWITAFSAIAASEIVSVLVSRGVGMLVKLVEGKFKISNKEKGETDNG